MFLLPQINYVFLKNIKYNRRISDDVIDSNYCVITVKNNLIICSYFRFSENNFCQYSQIDFSSSSADLLFDLISEHYDLSQSISLSHALYLGKEIYKAELALIFLQVYVQS